MKHAWLLVFALQALSQGAFAYEQCGSLNNAYGPYDFWVDKDRIGIVEGAHLRAEDEKGSWGGGLDYTLRAIPNHPRALMSMMRMGEQYKLERLPGAHYSVECYFDRALRFRPNDGMARMIYANYLAKHGRNAEAVTQLEKAQETAGDSANLHYNIGLAYFEVRDYEKSLLHAHKAYAMGFQLPGLKNKLEKAGKWREPEKAAPAAESAKSDGAPSEGTGGATPKPQASAPPSPASAPVPATPDTADAAKAGR